MKKIKTIICLFFSILLLAGCQKKDDKQKIVVEGETSASSEQSQPVSAESTRTLGTIEGINGTVVEYDDKILRGGNVLTREGMSYLKKKGVTDILAVSNIEEETKLATAFGITVHGLEFSHETGLSKEHMQKMDKIFATAKGKIYLHCVGGKNRGGTLAIYYRLSQQKWTWDKAFHEFQALGGNVEKYPHMLDSLKKIY